MLGGVLVCGGKKENLLDQLKFSLTNISLAVDYLTGTRLGPRDTKQIVSRHCCC